MNFEAFDYAIDNFLKMCSFFLSDPSEILWISEISLKVTQRMHKNLLSLLAWQLITCH